MAQHLASSDDDNIDDDNIDDDKATTTTTSIFHMSPRMVRKGGGLCGLS